jgi:hypothetical protein
VHPIERLRYVARSSGADQSVLVRETAHSLSTFRDDPAGMVMACRRMLARHVESGPLWWLTSRVCCAVDPIREAWAAAERFEEDRTARELALAIPDDVTVCVLGWPEIVADALPSRGDLEVLVVDVHGEGTGLVRRLRRADVDAVDVPIAGLGAAAASSHVVLAEASVAGPEAFIAVSGTRAAAATSRHAGGDVWLVAGVGRLLPAPIWEVIDTRREGDEEPWEAKDEVVPMDLVSYVAGPDGVEATADALAKVDTPVAPELFREGVL